MPSKRLKYTKGAGFYPQRPNFPLFWPESLVKSGQHSSGVPGNTVINYVANLTELKELIGPIRDYPDKLHLITHLFYNKNLDLSPNCLLVNLCHIFNYASAVSLWLICKCGLRLSGLEQVHLRTGLVIQSQADLILGLRFMCEGFFCTAPWRAHSMGGQSSFSRGGSFSQKTESPNPAQLI